MASRRIVTCDMCGSTRPSKYEHQKGWVDVMITGGSLDTHFCSRCWAPIEKVIRRQFVSEMLSEAGIVLTKT